MLNRLKIALALFLSLVCSTVSATAADDGNVRIIGAYGLQFLLNYVVVENKLIEKHANALGISDPKVTLNLVSNGGAINDALISSSADIGGVPGPALVLLWGKTKGRQAIRGVLPYAEIPPILLTIDPHIKTLADFTETDRIAMPTVKISSYAIMLQMAAIQQFGWEQRFKFDPMSVQLGFSETVSSLLSGGTEVKSAVVVAPFNAVLLESGKARQILSLDDILGNHGTLTVLAASERFHSEKPKTYAAVKAAYEDAIQFINDNPKEAARIFVKWEPNKQGPDWIQKVLTDDKLVRYTRDPHRFGKLSEFLRQIGTIKSQPTSWKELFFDQGDGLNGD